MRNQWIMAAGVKRQLSHHEWPAWRQAWWMKSQPSLAARSCLRVLRVVEIRRCIAGPPGPWWVRKIPLCTGVPLFSRDEAAWGYRCLNAIRIMAHFLFQWTYKDSAIQAMLTSLRIAPGNCAKPSRHSAARSTNSSLSSARTMALPSSNSPTSRAALPVTSPLPERVPTGLSRPLFCSRLRRVLCDAEGEPNANRLSAPRRLLVSVRWVVERSRAQTRTGYQPPVGYGPGRAVGCRVGVTARWPPGSGPERPRAGGI